MKRKQIQKDKTSKIDKQLTLSANSYIDLEMGQQINNESIEDIHNQSKKIKDTLNAQEKSTEEWEQELKQKMKRRNAEKIEKAAIDKYFGHFAYLPKANLKQIKAEMERYIEENKKGKSGIELVRFSLRQKLIKVCLIAVAEFLNKNVAAVNKMQEVYLRPESDKLGMITIIVHSLQSLLFQELYQENTKSREQPYQNKMKMLFQHLYDEVNFKLRRSFINKTLTPKLILNLNEENILSEEVKERDKQSMRRLIQESQDLEVALQQEYKRKENQIQQQKKQLMETNAEPALQPYSDVVEIDQQMETADVCEMENTKIQDKAVQEYETVVKKVRTNMESCRIRMRERLDKLPQDMRRKLKLNFRKMMKIT